MRGRPYFTLGSDDRAWLQRSARGAGNRLGLAVQLCALPWLGFVPDEVPAVPRSASNRLAVQLGLPVAELDSYGEREQTRTEHLRLAAARLGWRTAGAREWKELDEFLLARAVEHDAPSVLFRTRVLSDASALSPPPIVSPNHRYQQARGGSSIRCGPAGEVGCVVSALGSLGRLHGVATITCMLSADHRDLVRAAVAHAESVNDDNDHTVAAALRLQSGAVVLGVNTHHFLGGPCGEISALSNRAAAHPDDTITAVAAAYGPTGGVIPPCGKCRQILFDIDPAIRCVVREANGLTAVPVRDLLPHAFDGRALEEHQQRLYMWEGYEDSIRDGSKRQTIRVDDPFRPGEACIVFEKESGAVVELPADIVSVRTAARAELTERDAQRDGFADLAALHTALDQHYPGLGPEDPLDIVAFALHVEK